MPVRKGVEARIESRTESRIRSEGLVEVQLPVDMMWLQPTLKRIILQGLRSASAPH